MTMIKSIKTMTPYRNGTKSNISAKVLNVIHRESQITLADKQIIYSEFEKLVLLRCENINDYKFDAVYEYLNGEGYSKNDILEMLHEAKSMPRKGNNRLAAGDLITAWKKNREAFMNISWQEFNKAFKVMCDLNFELLNNVCIELTGIGILSQNDKTKIFDFMKKQMENIELERIKVEYENKLQNDRAVIKWRERGEISLKAENIIKQVKLELIEWFIKTYEKRKTLNHPAPANHIYELKEKLLHI
jgi:hypothetical protein